MVQGEDEWSIDDPAGTVDFVGEELSSHSFDLNNNLSPEYEGNVFQSNSGSSSSRQAAMSSRRYLDLAFGSCHSPVKTSADIVSV